LGWTINLLAAAGIAFAQRTAAEIQAQHRKGSLRANWRDLLDSRQTDLEMAKQGGVFGRSKTAIRQ
jgi:hypothetical protein